VAQVIELLKLPAGQVPPQFKTERYFDLKAHPFAHGAFFSDPAVTNVVSAVRAISAYTTKWLKENLPKLEAQRNAKIVTDPTPYWGGSSVLRCRFAVEPGALCAPSCVIGVPDGKERNTLYVAAGASVAGEIYLDKGSVYVGEGTTIERGAAIKGPAVIGRKNEIRMGAYFRGDILIGDGGTFRGELKNVVMLDKANFPHPSYVGDSICGYMSHFGNQATAANLGIFEGVREPSKRKNLLMKVDGRQYDLGGPKLGVILGDFSQVGCNSVADPGTFFAPYTIVYPLTRVNRGFYGPNVLIKNKPMEHGIIEVVPLASLD
jgi:hypothetical protein